MLLGLLVAGCAAATAELEPVVDRDPLIAAPVVDAFGHCSGHGCRSLQRIGLSAEEWASIGRIFADGAATAAEERRQIAEAVARFERLTGPKTGTQADLGGTWPGFLQAGQLDCVDETLNTRTLLRLLEAEGLLARHRLGPPAARGNIIDGLPHRTAVVLERETGTAYAIDSWFYDSGELPEVVLLASWLDGWRPPP